MTEGSENNLEPSCMLIDGHRVRAWSGSVNHLGSTGNIASRRHPQDGLRSRMKHEVPTFFDDLDGRPRLHYSSNFLNVVVRTPCVRFCEAMRRTSNTAGHCGVYGENPSKSRPDVSRIVRTLFSGIPNATSVKRTWSNSSSSNGSGPVKL